MGTVMDEKPCPNAPLTTAAQRVISTSVMSSVCGNIASRGGSAFYNLA